MTQTVGRAARNVNGKVIMYADRITQSMRRTIDETYRRRAIQLKYNEKHNITPTQIKKALTANLIGEHAKPEITAAISPRGYTPKATGAALVAEDPVMKYMTREQMDKAIANATQKMKDAAQALEFTQAAYYRDEIVSLQQKMTSMFGD